MMVVMVRMMTTPIQCDVYSFGIVLTKFHNKGFANTIFFLGEVIIPWIRGFFFLLSVLSKIIVLNIF